MNARAHGQLDAAWFARAACKGHHELFFGPKGEQHLERARRENRAKAICVTCPVIDECREWARAHREPGVWGGESELQRAAAGYAPQKPGTHIQRDLRRQAEREISTSLALGDLTDDQVEAIARLIEGDSTCS